MTAQKRPSPPVVKLHPETHARLRQLSNEQHRPMGEIVTDLLKRYEREEFWRKVNESVERLREDPVAWKDYQDEIASLQGGSMDRLEHEEPWFSPEEEEEIRAEAARSRGG